MDRRAIAGGIGVIALVALVSATLVTERAGPPPSDEPSSTPPSATVTEPTGPMVLLPNLRSLNAGDLQVEVIGESRRLRFAARLANFGPGPLVLRPKGREQCGPQEHSALQIVYVDRDGDGGYQRKRDGGRTRQFAGCMLRHRGHDHWHFDAMAAYSLRRPGSDTPLVARDKVSFCLRDNERIAGEPVVVRREHFGECSADRVQGISPGWVDIYKADLDGQWLRIPARVDTEVLCLDLAADPADLVEETVETDNATSVAIRVAGNGVRRADRGLCR